MQASRYGSVIIFMKKAVHHLTAEVAEETKDRRGNKKASGSCKEIDEIFLRALCGYKENDSLCVLCGESF
jgi:hypothetical protein